MRLRTLTATVAAVALVASGGIVAASSASAAPIPKQGHTRMVLKKTTVDRLGAAGISITPAKPAHWQGGVSDNTIKIPIDGQTNLGTISHNGGFIFAKGGTKVTCSGMSISLPARTIFCNIGSTKYVPLFRITTNPNQRVKGKTVYVSNMRIAVNGSFMAQALNSSLNTNTFVDGLEVGILNSVYAI